MRKLLTATGLLLLLVLPSFAQKWDTIAASNSSCVYGACVYLDLDRDDQYAAVQVTGTFSATLQFEASVDKSTFVAIAGLPSSGGSSATSATAVGAWQFSVAGYRQLRVRASARASGSASITIRTAPGAVSNANYPGVASDGANGLSIGSAVVGTTLLTNSEYDNGTCTTAATITPTHGNRQKLTLTNAQTCALTFVQPTSGTVSIQLTVIQSSAGSFNGAISGGMWTGGTVPTITATSGAVDVITCYLNGTNAKCFATQDFR